MLLELKVSNFAIIENIHIEFGRGLNILTGETGAGKSVLLKSLSLLMGFKGSTESIRSGFAQAHIEGSFDISRRPDVQERLTELGIEFEDDLLVVKRVLSEEKSRVYINGSLSTLNTLRDLVAPLIEVAGQSAPLIEMTGQFENRHLLSKAYHLDLLDQYTSVWEKRTLYAEKYRTYKNLQDEITALTNADLRDNERVDFLTFQRDEISALNLRPGEELELEAELRRLKNSSRWTEFVEQAEDALLTGGGSAVDGLSLVIKKSAEFTSHDILLARQIDSLVQSRTLIEDAMFEVRRLSALIDSDPRRLETLEQRLSSLRKLQKKYGNSVEEILGALKKIETELNLLENREGRLAEMRARADVLAGELGELARDMHKRRKSGANLLAESVNAELADLNMKGVSFHVQVAETPGLTASGTTDIEFVSRASNKDPLRPLAKFASGGELSRILLSLKRVVGSSTQPRTYLFDEVDTGVSGPTAEKVGKKLHLIGKNQQVICVTHLPQVAAFGDSHFYIQKASGKGAVTMDVSALRANERVNEIARLISGEKITKTSIAHAKELLGQV